MSDKKMLRREMLARRNALSDQEHRLLSEKIFEAIFGLEEISRAEKVHIFSSFGREPDTLPVQQRLLELGKEVYTSHIHEGIELLHSRLVLGQRFDLGRYGVPHPVLASGQNYLHSDELGFSENDLIFVPFLAFDRDFYRLGFGKGYYDVFLSTCSGKKIGLGFTFQEHPALPHEVHDIALDIIITEKNILRRD